MRKVAAGGIVFLVSCLAGVLALFFVQFRLSLPQVNGRLALRGLSQDVRIIRDSWGVPHILAQNEIDLFFAVGFVHAQDRMWQMELIRRFNSGTLSEVLGDATVENDVLIRALGLPEAAEKDVQKLGEPARGLLESYAAGVNSWMGSRRRDWPPEFMILRFRPRPWTIKDSCAVKGILALTLCADYRSELDRAKVVKTLGAEKALELLEEGIISVPDLQGFAAAAVPGSSEGSESRGSNNWVLDGSRTKTGKPLLANDPHLDITVPPIWYEMHLDCPTFHATGVTVPGVPFIIIGHNEAIAWGVTNSYADVQDLRVEKLDASGSTYLSPEGWKPLRKKEELIPVKGQKNPERISVLWTERGPIVSPHVVAGDTPVSLSWTIYEGGRELEGIYGLNKARNWGEFSAAMSLVDAPAQNFVYADIHGDIGYYLNGKIPVRDKEAALFPAPGWAASSKWRGYLEEGQKPNLYNPASGFIVTANNKIVPPDYPYYISNDWISPFRAERIGELLLGEEKHSIESLQRIQNDIHSKRAEFFIPQIKSTAPQDDKARAARELLSTWDMEMGRGAQAALFGVFMDYFYEDTLKDELGKDYPELRDFLTDKPTGLMRFGSDPKSSWFDIKGTAAIETRDDIIEMSLKRAYDWLLNKYGAPEKWDWTKLHALKFRHALGRTPLLRFLNCGSRPMSGDGATVRASNSGAGFETTGGASYRQIIDLGDLSRSVCVITSGQSGHFLSRHYDDQIPLWLEGGYHPMLFNREDVEAHKAAVLVLVPVKEEK